MNSKTLAVACIAVVIAAIGYGFMETGGPFYQRKLKSDNTRLERITRIASAIEQYHRKNKHLPDNLPTLEETRTQHHYYLQDDDLSDPVTSTPFLYRVVSARTYVLCGTFETANTGKRKQRYQGYSHYGNQWDDDHWQHPAGYHCFTYEIEQPDAKK